MSRQDRAAEVAAYLHGEGRHASPKEHRAVLDERWPDLTPDELGRALRIRSEIENADEDERAFLAGEQPRW